MAFVVVQHLAPTHPSSLAEILSRATSMPVREVRDEPRVEPNHVYVIPPGRDMVVANGFLKLLPQERRAQHRGIDQFFRSLAEDCGHKAIGVVLSGGASDGTLGLEAIKAEGGITFAQDESAQHDSMPRSAIASGCVDFVLPPEQIAQEITRIARHPYVAPKQEDLAAKHEDHARIAQILQRGTGVDFTHYKLNTLHRRITRRMLLHKLDGLKEYEEHLRESPQEVQALYQDILIGVTSFFRNPEAFEALASKVFPRLLKDRSRGEPLRIWTIGCSTGEEAYSLAMTFTECAEAANSDVPLQLFATDLNGTAIEKARVGSFANSIAQDVSPQRLRRFFVEENGHYRISKTIRERCVFSRHDVLSDPPFSRVDLISCRNLLIYLEPVLQQRILALLHYSLKPEGFLWLGSSESIGAYRSLFDVEDARHKIFARRPGASPPAARFRPRESTLGGRPATAAPGRPEPVHRDLHKEAERILLTKFAPPGVVVSADMEIVQFRGHTGDYLAPMAGHASLNLLKMLREGLMVAVRAAILQAGKQKSPVRKEGLRVHSNGGLRELAIEVIPIDTGSAHGDGFLVLFDEGPAPRRSKAQKEPARQADDEISRLTQEHAATRETLQSDIEYQEVANQELQSAIEEAQSANEEMQSLNEELETSKEEIQSSNEELATINAELANRNLELDRTADDLGNVLASVQMPILIVGRDLRVRRFTPIAEKLLRLVAADIGRLLGDIKLALPIPDLEPVLIDVIENAVAHEREIQDSGGRWYSLRIRPYVTRQNRIDGAVVSLVDVDTLRRTRDYAESIVASVRAPLVVLDSALRVKTVSRSFCDVFQVAAEEVEGRLIYDLGNRQWDIPALRTLLEEVLPRDHRINDFEVRHTFEQLGPRTMVLNARRLAQGTESEPLIVLAIEDVTDRRALEEALVKRANDLVQGDRRKDEFLAMLAHELRNPLEPLRDAAEVLQSTEGSKDADSKIRDEAWRILTRQIENISRLVDDLLDVARITQGRIQLRRQPVTLGSILASAENVVRSAVKARNQTLTVSLPDVPVYLNADATRLEQVFGNLLHNASKYGGPGCHVWLTAVSADGDGQRPPEVIVRVRDDGIGIAPELLPRVFDLFVQAAPSLDRKSAGLGIGLTIVRQLVMLHGGSVEARSEGLGHGSEFVVRLPVLLEPAASLPPPRAAERGASRRVLVVDDNEDVAIGIAMLLRLNDHETRTAFTGADAIAVAAGFHPEVVLLDIGLPGMDGWELARRLRAMPEASQALLVGISGYGRDEDRVKARAVGFDEYLIKPVNLDLLRKLLEAPILNRDLPASPASPG